LDDRVCGKFVVYIHFRLEAAIFDIPLTVTQDSIRTSAVILLDLKTYRYSRWNFVYNNNNNCPTDHCDYRTDGGLFTDTGEYGLSENKRQSENDYEMKTLAGSRDQRTDKSWCKKTKEQRIVQREKFEFRVKLMRGQGKWRSIESVAVTSDGGAEGCRSCLGREFRSMVGKRPGSYFET